MKANIKRTRKKYVNLSSEGFTLLEALIGLSTFCIVTALLPLLLQVLNDVNKSSERLQTLQWEVFSSQFKKEIRMSQRIDPQSNRLFLTKDTDSIIYEQYGSNIRRRVNFTGNEILLQNVKSIRFDPIKNGTNVIVEDIWNRNHSVSAQSFINTGN